MCTGKPEDFTRFVGEILDGPQCLVVLQQQDQNFTETMKLPFQSEKGLPVDVEYLLNVIVVQSGDRCVTFIKLIDESWKSVDHVDEESAASMSFVQVQRMCIHCCILFHMRIEAHSPSDPPCIRIDVASLADEKVEKVSTSIVTSSSSSAPVLSVNSTAAIKMNVTNTSDSSASIQARNEQNCK